MRRLIIFKSKHYNLWNRFIKLPWFIYIMCCLAIALMVCDPPWMRWVAPYNISLKLKKDNLNFKIAALEYKQGELIRKHQKKLQEIVRIIRKIQYMGVGPYFKKPKYRQLVGWKNK